MILDSRIKEGKRPLTCLDIEQAREFVGKLCLFSSSFANYKNIREYAEHQQYTGTLSVKDKFKFIANEESPYRNENDGYLYELVLPLEWIEQPKTPEFEQYTLDTWEHEFEPGDVIIFRGKDGTDREGGKYKCIYAGWRKDLSRIVIIILGTWSFTFKQLFESYEIYRDNTWEPFGRKVETINLGH